jgi:hypothetical protein
VAIALPLTTIEREFMNPAQISRRTMLRETGGALLGLPYLVAMIHS